MFSSTWRVARPFVTTRCLCKMINNRVSHSNWLFERSGHGSKRKSLLMPFILPLGIRASWLTWTAAVIGLPSIDSLNGVSRIWCLFSCYAWKKGRFTSPPLCAMPKQKKKRRKNHRNLTVFKHSAVGGSPRWRTCQHWPLFFPHSDDQK